MMDTVYLAVKGMHCPDCPKKVERSISKLDGVTAVKVNYEGENGSVTFDKHFVSIADIINKINKMGFEAKNITSYSK